jgi:hypothetical protein
MKRARGGVSPQPPYFMANVRDTSWFHRLDRRTK